MDTCDPLGAIAVPSRQRLRSREAPAVCEALYSAPQRRRCPVPRQWGGTSTAASREALITAPHGRPRRISPPQTRSEHTRENSRVGGRRVKTTTTPAVQEALYSVPHRRRRRTLHLGTGTTRPAVREALTTTPHGRPTEAYHALLNRSTRGASHLKATEGQVAQRSGVVSTP